MSNVNRHKPTKKVPVGSKCTASTLHVRGARVKKTWKRTYFGPRAFPVVTKGVAAPCASRRKGA